MDIQTRRQCWALCLLLYSFMSQQPIIVAGDGNIAGTNLINVGNRTVQNFFGGGSERDNSTLLLHRYGFASDQREQGSLY